ncbi:Hym1p [Malassezia japonica]|uniref:Hym1p n=1 Tax=Malassezia japonica TaxID=223818 RepID=A0AAF0F155_9BASI|nr:Hym1p [Malassezia japonica]WFD38119.1 Hym1p [Malassezia japonica]
MNFLFKAKQRTPHELARSMREAIARLGVVQLSNGTLHLSETVGAETRRKVGEELYQSIQQAKHILYGEAGNEPVPELVAQFAQETYQDRLMQYLLVILPRLEFEARKDVVQIFTVLLQRSIGTRLPTVEYISSNPSIVLLALRGYEDADIALNTGMILHEMLQHEALAKILLYSEDFYRFPNYIDTSSFGVSCDAFANFREALVRHKSVAAEYIAQNYEHFFAMYNHLLDSTSYVAKRQSLKLLGEMLVDRAHYQMMLRYVADDGNLKRIMNLLRDRSKNIQLEAFHVFKVFVANPKKSPGVEAILQRNRARLLTFLSEFQRDRSDESFIDERQYVMQIIATLPAKGP